MPYDKSYKLSEDGKKIFTHEWLEVGNKNPFNYQVSYLVLDFNKIKETQTCVESIRTNTKFKDYEIVLLSNGGNQHYTYELYKRNLIDRLLLYKRNMGCGVGTHDLFNASKSEYSIYVQNDQFLGREFTQEELDLLKNELNQETKLVDLSGGAGHSDKYSERAHIVKTEFYNNLHLKCYGGPGPFEKIWQWSEGGASYAFWDEDYKIKHDWPTLFGNNGYRSIREKEDGEVIEVIY